MPKAHLMNRRVLAVALLAVCAAPLDAIPEAYAAKRQEPEQPSSGPEITFIGFSPNGNVGMVYVDLSAPAKVTRTDANGKVSFLIAGSVIHGKNNQRPLPTEAFGTPIRSVRLVPGKEGATLLLTLEGKPVVTQKLIRGDSGARLSVQASPGAGQAP
jgi:hypothetical protein